MTAERWQQITAIFHAALARDEADRAAFVQSSCGDDAALRCEVESLIAAHLNAGGFGETPVLGHTPRAAVGLSIGPYRIERWIGAGGMGEVYKATDTRLGRTVALKILAPHLAGDPAFRFRFEREARTISQLEHQHICALYDVGEQDETAYLVMRVWKAKRSPSASGGARCRLRRRSPRPLKSPMPWTARTQPVSFTAI